MKKPLIVMVLFAAVTLVLGAGLWIGQSPQSAPAASTVNRPLGEMPPAMIAHNHAPVARVPAHHNTAPGLNTLPPTLSPELFSGNQRLAYQAAKEFPQTLAQLPCYCHCDKGLGHKSLHSCFESEHGENCGICIGEAIMTYHLEKRSKLSVAEIRQRIIAAYGTAQNE